MTDDHGAGWIDPSRPGLARLERAIAEATDRHTRLVLVVGGSWLDVSRMLAEYANRVGTSVLKLGLTLSERLLGTQGRHRPVAAADLASDLIRAAPDDQPVLIDQLELLFLAELKLDPLKLLSDSARSRIVVAAWPGRWLGSTLQYAVPSHPEFREYHSPDCLVVEAASSCIRDRS